MLASVLALWSRRVNSLSISSRDSSRIDVFEVAEEIVFDSDTGASSPDGHDSINSGLHASLAQR